MKKAIAFTVLVLLLAGCSLSMEQEIVGTWSQDTDPGYTITFANGGAFSTSDGTSGTWSIEDDTLTVKAGGTTSALIIISLNETTLVLSSGLLQFSYTRL